MTNDPEFDYVKNPQNITGAKLMRAALVFLALGAVFISTGCFLWHGEQKFMATAVSAEGFIEKYQQGLSADHQHHGMVFRAVVQFQDQQNHSVIFEDKKEFDAPRPSAGKIWVLYDPANPQDAIIDRGILNWMMPMLLIVAGGVMAAGGVYGFITALRRPKSVT